MTPEQALNKLDETLIGDLELKIVLSKALEKQIPKTPIPIIAKIGEQKRLVSYKCPNCTNDSLGNCEFHFDYCEVCGQKLSWEGVL